MLKRHQVLLTDWQTEHLKLIARRNDLSFSEMIRVVLCEGLLCSAGAIHPELKGKINKEKLEKIVVEGASAKTSVERKHQLVSDLYFEARKITEAINAKLHKENGKTG